MHSEFPEDALRNAIKALDELASESESDFLMVGERLQHFSQLAKSIAGQGNETAAFMTGDEIMAAIQQLQTLLSRISRYLNYSMDETHRQTQQLDGIYKRLADLDTPLKGIQKLVKHLAILSLTIRIENARIQSGQQAFAHLVVDVQRLGEQIDQKTKIMQKQIGHISQSGWAEYQEIQRLELQLNDKAAQIMSNIAVQLDSLVCERRAASKRALQMAERIEAIGGQFNLMIQSLQFHDIFRQRVEHVCEALTTLLENRAQPGGSGEREAQAALIRLQVMQLNECRRNVDEAMGMIRESLVQMGQLTTEIFDVSQENRSREGDGQETALIGVRTGIEGILETLNEAVKGGFDLNKLLCGIVGMVREAGHFVDDIDFVGSEIELVAQNGIIHAARLGEAGNALSVLADEIQRLSNHSHGHIDTVSGHLKAIAGQTDLMGTGHGDAADEMASIRVVEAMGEDLLALVQTLESVNAQVIERLNRVDALSHAFHEGLSELSGQIQVDRRVSVLLSEVARQLSQSADDWYPQGQCATTLDGTAASVQEERYTMEAEREIHQAFLLGAEAQDKLREAAYIQVDVDQNEVLLEDNIEFF